MDEQVAGGGHECLLLDIVVFPEDRNVDANTFAVIWFNETCWYRAVHDRNWFLLRLLAKTWVQALWDLQFPGSYRWHHWHLRSCRNAKNAAPGSWGCWAHLLLQKAPKVGCLGCTPASLPTYTHCSSWGHTTTRLHQFKQQKWNCLKISFIDVFRCWADTRFSA